MPAYKDKAKGTWYASFYFENWTGKKEKKMKRGFKTKREALEWERTFLQQQTADLDMTFESFVALYAADVKGRIKENTWGTKEHILYKKLVPYFGKRKMCDIHSKEVIAWHNEVLGYRDKNGKPYTVFSAFSAEKTEDGFEYQWVRFLCFDRGREEWLQPGARVEVKGAMSVAVHNGKPDLSCRAEELAPYVAEPDNANR